MFRNHCRKKDALKNQYRATGIEVRQLTLDIPVCWSLTYQMIDIALKLQAPITALCVLQQLDISIRDIALTAID
jgi:hypothetical protein